MTDFEAKAVVDAINRMFKGQTFYITDVDNCMKVTGAIRTTDYDALRLYHCVSFDTMDADTKSFVFQATIENVCNVDEFPAVRLIRRSDEIEEKLAMSHKQQPLLKRLFGHRT